MYKAKKHLGQNFLHDPNIIRKIVTVIAPQAGQIIIEIGPGLGALTHAILPVVKHLDVIELDAGVIPHLQQTCAGLGELTIHHQDALTYDFSQHANNTQLRIIGNLPYNISSPLLFHLMQYSKHIKDMHFMLQKEVVERMAAKSGTASYGRLSVMLQYHCQIQHLFNVPPGAFHPTPKVDSAIVRLIPYQTLPAIANNYEDFVELVKQAFSQRRKTLRNCLKKLCQSEHFQQANIDPQLRAEMLSVADFVKLANIISIPLQDANNAVKW